MIAAVIVIALSRLMITVVEVLIIRALNPLEHETFQMVFGEILTLLIALEFNHTLQYVITREKGIVQARVVLKTRRHNPRCCGTLSRPESELIALDEPCASRAGQRLLHQRPAHVPAALSRFGPVARGRELLPPAT